ncbi:AraC family transcriptional regulator [Zhihengliuella halotolerans]|uniref:AraC family transcriptional regulator n=1 Tax=Zhihengliuella halotolerans TaxID=370736 RepID=A0A4Q8ACT8_9MICC|nr:AraC family transcriptional regulator [Zhihengliuella halotolerans]RZU61904.1 AraC family transcriptional regulator [Zhihengliuella halotolerans]
MQQWNQAIEMIEANLATDIDVADIARAAATSEYHFRRMFSTLAGMPLSEYVRRRRMTVAAAELIRGCGVLETAVKYGYTSAEAFNRAFKVVHGVSPVAARTPGTHLASQSRLSFHLRVEGTTPMKHRIVDLPAFTLAGHSKSVPVIHSGPNPHIIDFERSITAEMRQRIADLNDVEPAGLFSVTANGDPEGREGTDVDYWRAAATSKPVPDDLESLDIPAGRWVVFASAGAMPEAAQRLWADAAAEWFPANPYRWAPGPQLLSVDLAPGGAKGDAVLWIPIEDETGAV